MSQQTTTENYLHQTREAVIVAALARTSITPVEAAQLARTKLLYGLGDGTYRGVCHYSAWDAGTDQKVDVVEIAATAQESWIQLAGTVIHELGHVLAGWSAGHGPEWREATVKLGFTIKPAAAGQRYWLSMITPTVRTAVYTLAREIGDGQPAFAMAGAGSGLAGLLGLLPAKPRPCSAGVGTRGGKSRGKGSGSRQLLWECQCQPVQKIRAATKDLDVTCNRCGAKFELKD